VKKKKRFAFAILSVFVLATNAMPVFAAKDPNVETVAYIDYSNSTLTKIKGKSYAVTFNSNMKQLNVNGQFFQGTSQIENGTQSVNSVGSEASWYTKEYTNPGKGLGTYTLQTTSRTYYKDGTFSDQSFSSATW